MSSPVNATLGPRKWAAGAFYLGLALGTVVLAAIVWANFEARMFYPSDMFTPGSKRERLRELRCPLAVSRDETARLHLRVTNPLDRPVRRFVRITVALRHLLLVDQEKIWLDLGPRERRAVTWDIPASQGVYGGWFLMTSVYLGARGSLPPAMNDCGILVLPVRGVPGAWVLAGLFGLTFGLMSAGLFVGGLNTAEGPARVLFGLYLAAWLAQVAGRGWVLSGVLLAVLALTALFAGLQRLEGNGGPG